MAYRSPTCACICVRIFCTIYKSGVAQGGGEDSPKTSDRADKNAVSV